MRITAAGVLAAIAVMIVTACGKEEEKETMVIAGGQEYIYAPGEGGEARTAPFVLMAGEGERARAADAVWEIVSTSPGASISPDGVVTIDDTYVAGDINGTDIIIQAVCGSADAADGAEPATAVLHVREARRLASFEILLPDCVRTDEEGTEISLTGWTDQYGGPMEAPDSPVQWAFSEEGLEVEDGRLMARGRTGREIFAAVSARVDGVEVQKRFILSGQESYTPDEKALERLAGADLSILREVDFGQAREVDAAAYSYVAESLEGMSELTVDVSGMANASPSAVYQVTIRGTDGSAVTEDRKADGDGKLTITLRDAEAVEVAPVLRFSLGKCGLGADEGYVHVACTDQYTGAEPWGFYGGVADTAGGVSMRGEDNLFVTALPDGFYNIRITKPQSGTGRSTVRVNGASMGTNVGNPGTGGRTGKVPYTYLMEDVRVEGGTARLSLGEKDDTLAAVEVRKTPEILKRRVHIYLGGDSTVSNYYPIEESEPEPGRFQTGWGQVFGQFVTEENAVTNLAGGGTYAKSWYEMAFPGVLQNGQPGDYFIIQAGINDRTYSSREEMVEYLTRMIDECREKGMIVILATAMQSPKFWKDRDGNELGEHGTPEGSGLAPYMDAIRQLAAEKEAVLVDTGRLTGEWYAKVGRTYVAQNYHLYNRETGVEEDTLHLSYHGALKIAELIATALSEMQVQDDTLSGLSFRERKAYQVVYTDGGGRETVITTEGIRPVYKRYGEQ